MRVSVTADDIMHGKRRSSKSCPVALAVNRVIDPLCYASVAAGTVRVGMLVYALPLEAKEFVSAFDAELPVEPFDFDLSSVRFETPFLTRY